jgi:hypothetical protein
MSWSRALVALTLLAVGAVAHQSAIAQSGDTQPPTGTISGPDQPVAGRPASYSVEPAPDASGVDPNSFSWSASYRTGVLTATGPSATFNFPTDGPATIRVTFRDNAGNRGEATKRVEVGTLPVSQRARPKIRARVSPLVDRRRPFRFTVSGTVAAPEGVPTEELCNSRMTISYHAGRRRLFRLQLGLRPACAFRTRATFRTGRDFGRARSLVIRLSVPATATTQPARVRLEAKVR